jgi:hypothetical protein
MSAVGVNPSPNWTEHSVVTSRSSPAAWNAAERLRQAKLDPRVGMVDRAHAAQSPPTQLPTAHAKKGAPRRHQCELGIRQLNVHGRLVQGAGVCHNHEPLAQAQGLFTRVAPGRRAR